MHLLVHAWRLNSLWFQIRGEKHIFNITVFVAIMHAFTGRLPAGLCDGMCVFMFQCLCVWWYHDKWKLLKIISLYGFSKVPITNFGSNFVYFWKIYSFILASYLGETHLFKLPILLHSGSLFSVPQITFCPFIK